MSDSHPPARIQPAARDVTARPASPPSVDPKVLLRSLRRRLGLAIGLGLCGAAAAAAVAYLVVPPAKYTASATIRVATARPKVLFTTAEEAVEYRIFQRTQLALVKSGKVLEAVLRDPEAAGLPTLREVVRQGQDPAEWLDQAVQAEFSNNSEILRISMSGSSPKDLEVLVNKVTDQYMKHVAGDEEKHRDDRSETLKRLWGKYQEDIKARRGQLRQMAVDVGSDDKKTLVMKNQMIVHQIGSIEDERLRLKSDVRRLRAEVAVQEAEHRRAAAEPPPDGAVEEQIARDGAVAQLRANVEELAKRHARAQSLARHADDITVQRTRSDLEAARRRLAERVARLRRDVPEQLREAAVGSRRDSIAQARSRIAAIEQIEKDLGGEVERLRQEMSTGTASAIDLQTEQDEVNVLAETARRIGAEVEAMDVEKQAQKRIRVIDYAKMPRTKDELKQAKAGGVAAAGAFAVVLAGVTFWEYRSRRIGSADEVVQGLGLRLVGALPALPAPGRRRLIGPSPSERDWHSILVESVDATRTALLHASRQESIRIVMVTSAGAGEGKTSLASHLATSLARAGRRTLLVDGDLRSPALCRLFGVASGPGVSEVLRGEATADEVIAATQFEELELMPAGAWDAGAIQALSRGDLQPTLDALRSRYDFIVVDSAPILPVVDSLLLGQHADAVIFSILRDVSRVPMVRSAYERLEGLGVRILGAVMAGTEISRGDAPRYTYPAPAGRQAGAGPGAERTA